MHLNQLVLRNFRNYVDCEIDFPSRVNLITGGNAQGKTSLLEAIYFLSTAKSHRAYPNDELIRHDESWFYLKGTIASNADNDGAIHSEMTLEVSNQLQGQRRFKLNGDIQPRLSQWMGQFKVVFFSPESLALVKGAPADRRRFIDLLICQIDSAYLKRLQDYQLVLKQRNELLKQIRGKHASPEQLGAWDGLLVEHGLFIIQTRSQILERLQMYAQEKHAKLTGDREGIELKYQPSPNLRESISLDKDSSLDRSDDESEALTKFESALNSSRRVDVMHGTTSVGPHRDNFSLVLQTQKQGLTLQEEAKPYASQGQQRTIALTLKLSELEVIRHATGKTPIVLLDDVVSELDDERRTFLMDLLGKLNAQTFITSTQREVLEADVDKCTVLTINDGCVLRREDR
ncbi:MAG: DNA replication/repair protein RecF [Candidatus Poribacteria bacterium]|nr:DNA replication/repair protein RecF [Candidatus Poribacteria bacterium]MDE0506938.1 DNA replication/repair protein RecF [Candidatus Poribacteria bacterium]